MNNHNGIELKYGRVRNVHFTDDFKKENKNLIDTLLDVSNAMCSLGWTCSPNKGFFEKLSGEQKNAIVDVVCMVLDELFDKGVVIVNGWECKTKIGGTTFKTCCFVNV